MVENDFQSEKDLDEKKEDCAKDREEIENVVEKEGVEISIFQRVKAFWI